MLSINRGNKNMDKDINLNKTMPILPNKKKLEMSKIEGNSFVNVEKKSDNSINNLCLICFENLPDAVFMDCGHGGISILQKFFLNFIFFIFI